MASLFKEIVIAAPRELIWGAIRDVGALHTRLVPGLVVDTQLDGDARIVTFDNGMIVREPIISIDDLHYRLAWSAENEALTHYNAAIQVFDEQVGSRIVWVTDFLPDEAATMIDELQDRGLATMKRTLEIAAELRTIAPWSFEIGPVRSPMR